MNPGGGLRTAVCGALLLLAPLPGLERPPAEAVAAAEALTAALKRRDHGAASAAALAVLAALPPDQRDRPLAHEAWYGLALARCRAGEVEGAVAAIRSAVEAGFADEERFRLDHELKPARKDPRCAGLFSGQPADAGILGCWQSAEGVLWRFEAQRLTVRDGDRLDLYRVRWVVDRLIGESGPPLVVRRQGEALDLEREGIHQRLERLAGLPVGLLPRPLPLGATAPTPVEVVAARAVVGDLVPLRALVLRHGWIDAHRFGRDSCRSAFATVVASDDLALQLACIPAAEADVRGKALDPQAWAAGFDRLRWRLVEPQRYGTQLVRRGGELRVYDLEEPEKVDERRAALGLGPLALLLQAQGAALGERIRR